MDNTSASPSVFRLADAQAQLAATPAILNAWLRPLPASWTTANEGGNTWSAFDVVGHLIHGDETDWLPRLRRILEHGEQKPFDAFDRFAQFEASRGKTLAQLLDTFADVRASSLAALADHRLTDPDLDRRGMHPALGPVTARQLLATWVAHDLDHLMQIARVLAYQYREDVGPWRAYLRVISGKQG
jgi:uncharacterized damage-inducible protein DinB